MKSKKPYSRVYVEITNICNRSCSFCHGTKRPPHRMTVDEFSLICSKLRPLTDYLYLHLMGEPLTHPDLSHLISLATEMGFKCAITTNGTLLRVRGDELISSGVYKVNVSVHSFEEGNDEDRLRYLSEIVDFANRASSAGILTVLRLWNKGHDGGKNDLTLSTLRSGLNGEWLEGSRGIRIRHKLHLEYGDRFDWPDLSAPDGGAGVFCYGLADHFGVLCDGRVVPCCLDSDGVLTLGDLLSESAETILSSERAESIRDGFKCRNAPEELCRRCGYARRFTKKDQNDEKL